MKRMNKYILFRAMQEEDDKLGKFQLKVKPDYDLVQRMKRSLKFEPKGYCYLRILNPKYLQIFLFCLVARTNTIPKKKNVIIKKMENGEQQEFNQAFIKYNDNRKVFNGPQELTKIAQKLNYHLMLIEKYHKQFTEDVINHSVGEFKREEKVLINQYKTEESQPPYLGQIKLEAPQEVIYIIRQKDACLLCAYSSKEFKNYQTTNSRSSIRDSTSSIPELRELTPESRKSVPNEKKIRQPERKSVPESSRKEITKSQKTEQSQKNKKSKKENIVQKEKQPKNVQEKKPKQIQMQQQLPENEQQQEEDEQTQKQHSYYTFGLILILVLVIMLAFGGLQISQRIPTPGITTIQKLIQWIDAIKGK